MNGDEQYCCGLTSDYCIVMTRLPILVPCQVSARIEELLHTAFENYFMLSEETSSGMMDGALAVRSGIPAVLRPAVHLFSKWPGGDCWHSRQGLAGSCGLGMQLNSALLYTSCHLLPPDTAPLCRPGA